jgi:hypothetical protein
VVAISPAARDDQLAVPGVGQAQDELGVVIPAVEGVERRVVREVAVDLDAEDAARAVGVLGVEPGPVARVGVDVGD